MLKAKAVINTLQALRQDSLLRSDMRRIRRVPELIR